MKIIVDKESIIRVVCDIDTLKASSKTVRYMVTDLILQMTPDVSYWEFIKNIQSTGLRLEFHYIADFTDFLEENELHISIDTYKEITRVWGRADERLLERVR